MRKFKKIKDSEIGKIKKWEKFKIKGESIYGGGDSDLDPNDIHVLEGSSLN